MGWQELEREAAALAAVREPFLLVRYQADFGSERPSVGGQLLTTRYASSGTLHAGSGTLHAQRIIARLRRVVPPEPSRAASAGGR